MKSKVRMFLSSLLAIFFLFGCAGTLLPRSTRNTEIKWETYDKFEKIYNTISKGQTEEQLKKIGLDPKIMPITIMSDREIRSEYLPNQSIKIDYLDEGVQECIKAKSQCFGYSFNFEKTHEKRIGSFWLDTLGIKRRTITSGWKFVGRVLLVIKKDNIARVVYIERSSGDPIIKKNTNTTKPLGPLQTAGEEAVKMGVGSTF